MPRLSEEDARRRARGRLAAALSTVVVVIGAGCGGAERAEPSVWADAVCDGFQDYAARIDDLAPRLEQGLDQGAGPAEAKRLIQDYLRDALRATDRLDDDLTAAGTPDVEGGTAAAEGLRDGVESSEQLLRRALDVAADLPADDPASFEQRVEELSDLLTAGMSETGPELEASNEELEVLLAERPACRQLGR